VQEQIGGCNREKKVGGTERRGRGAVKYGYGREKNSKEVRAQGDHKALKG
jgi:hypothetical protein